MARDELGYSLVFSRLCHFVALRRDDAPLRAAQDSIVRATLLFEEGFAADLEQLRASLRQLFTLNLEERDVIASLARLRSEGHVEHSDGGYRLTDAARTELEQRVSDAEELERQVREEWLSQVGSEVESLGTSPESVWSTLKTYLSRMFARHGVQTLRVLEPARDGRDDQPASSILEDVIVEELRGIPHSKAARLIRTFFVRDTELRRRYVAQLLDGTFSYFALTVDKETARLLGKALPPLRLVVDTNFIFGLLDLHANAFVSVSKEVVRLSQELRLPLSLYYHPLTIREFNSTLAWHARQLSRGSWSPALSKALLESSHLTGVERRFHSLNQLDRLDISEFFARYRNVTLLLDGLGLKPFQVSADELLASDQVLDDISRYKRFIEPREKRFTVLQHDIALCELIRRTRKLSDSAFHADTFFLTCDFNLWRFERRRSKKDGAPPATLLPNVFLQLLRPLVPRADDFDRGFVDTFSLPEFRTATSATGEAISRVASVLRLYSDLPESTAVSILANEALLSKVESNLEVPEEEIARVVDHAIAEELRDARMEVERLQGELEAAQNLGAAGLEQAERLRTKEAELARALQDVEALRREAEARSVSAESSSSQTPELSEEVRDTLREREQREAELSERVATLERSKQRSADIAWSLLYTILGSLSALLEIHLIERFGGTGHRLLVGGTWVFFVGVACIVQLTTAVRPRKEPGYWRALWYLLGILTPLNGVVSPSWAVVLVPLTLTVLLFALGALRRDSVRSGS